MGVRCSQCGGTDAAKFAKSAHSPTGYQAWCRRCTKHKPANRRELVEWLVAKIHAQRDVVWGVDTTLATALGMAAFWVQQNMNEWLRSEDADDARTGGMSG